MMSMEEVINLDEVPVLERQHARAGLFRSRTLLNGPEGTPENYFLQLSYTYSDFHSPRHRHNFDQVRVQLQADADFARDGVMRPGTIGYFPEGVFYGPQSIAGESATLVLQFGGASGGGYISEARFQEGVEELKAFGTFESGVFHRPKEDGGRKNQDAYEAVWEHIHGKRMEYPQSAHQEPVFMHPDDFAWSPEPGAPGVQRKLLGVFSERALRMSVLGVSAGGSATIAPNSICFVLAGSGSAQGKAWQQHATLRTGDAADAVNATTAAEILEIHIPHLVNA
jgi:hypothetical protein